MESRIDTPRPLGVFGLTGDDPWALDVDQLRLLRDAIDPPTRQLVSAYLLSATLVIPLMEYTTDALEGAFGVSGGSGIVSDGVYYWRRDAAEYVLHYGISVGLEPVTRMRSLAWRAPELDQDTVEFLDGRLFEILHRRQA